MTPNDDDDDGWIFDTVRAPTVKNPVFTDSFEDPREKLEDLHITSPQQPARPVANSTVRRTPAPDRSPSVRRTNQKRRSSGVKQPLGVDLSFGNSPSTVRQFRRVSNGMGDDSERQYPVPFGMDENACPKTLFDESTRHETKEAQLGRRAYSKGIGLACQEVLANTCDHEKREAISRVAEAISDLEMVDPEGLYHILRLCNEKMKTWVSLRLRTNDPC